MKRSIILMMALLSLNSVQAEENKEGHSSMTVTVNGEIISAYYDGEEITDERNALEVQTEEAICRFLNRDREELEFNEFCMLEDEGMTIEVKVDGVRYTFTCSMQGEIIGMRRRMGINVI